uniref:Oxidoreductase-like domain-containing protein n=1 Tax=Arion vulgaris TaxID=1028688 RepID=A0A0B6Y0S8_9EUPU
MCCQRQGLKLFTLIFTRKATILIVEPEIHFWTRSQRVLSYSKCTYSYLPRRLFSSKKDLHNDEKTATATKNVSELKTKHEDSIEHIPDLNKQNCVSDMSALLPDNEKHLEPALSAMMAEKNLPQSALKTIAVVPGKGPPPEPPITCCMSGCANCVWIKYAEELREYYKDGGERAKSALEKIEDPSLRAFVKLELGL